MAKVKLVKAQPKNTQFIYDLYCREQVLRGHGLHKSIPAPHWKSIIEGIVPGWENNYIIVQGAAYLGHALFQDYSKYDRRSEIVISVLPEMQNKGLGTGALKEMIKIAKAPTQEGGLGLECVWAGIIEDNIASRKLFERHKFCESGRVPNYFRFGSKRLARCMYTLSLV